MADMLTLTKDDIEYRKVALQRLVDSDCAYQSDVFELALCDQALVGLAVQPRPIEEAPKDGTRILALWGGEWVITYWAKRPGFEGWQMPSGMVVKAYDRSAWQPVQFTSLPEPRT